MKVETKSKKIESSTVQLYHLHFFTKLLNVPWPHMDIFSTAATLLFVWPKKEFLICWVVVFRLQRLKFSFSHCRVYQCRSNSIFLGVVNLLISSYMLSYFHVILINISFRTKALKINLFKIIQLLTLSSLSLTWSHGSLIVERHSEISISKNSTLLFAAETNDSFEQFS